MPADTLTVRLKRFDKTLPLPAYQTEGAAAFDLCAREAVTIAPRSFGYVPLNVAVELPPGYWGLLAARSSTHKRGLIPGNGLGVMDEDYKGDRDEYHSVLYNVGEQPVTIERGERVAQLVVLPHLPVALEEVEHLGNSDRGGFGTTGS